MQWALFLLGKKRDDKRIPLCIVILCKKNKNKIVTKSLHCYKTSDLEGALDLGEMNVHFCFIIINKKMTRNFDWRIFQRDSSLFQTKLTFKKNSLTK